MKKHVTLTLALCAAVAVSSTLGVADEVKPAPEKPLVQLALLLDTSGSMSGLIEQAKTQLWRIVNEFTSATSGGQRPEVQVALYHYGTPSLGADTGYIKQLVPLSTDLDKISEELFKLRTSGGDEYCGAVIKAATEGLQWSTGKNDYRAIFIAGNEPFTQGKVDFRKACKEAIARGIIVNTIHCGNNEQGIQTQWKDGADLADGSYFSIDHNTKVVNITTPFDKELAELNGKVNATYVAYGKAGAEGYARQAAQDANASSVAPAVMAQRAVTKGSGFYKNAEWDLVDAVKEKQVKLEDVKEEDLPEEMKKLAPGERGAYVEAKLQERAAIQEQIAKLGKERDAYVAVERKKQMAAGNTNTLDAAMVTAIRAQAGKASFQF